MLRGKFPPFLEVLKMVRSTPHSARTTTQIAAILLSSRMLSLVIHTAAFPPWIQADGVILLLRLPKRLVSWSTLPARRLNLSTFAL